MAVSIGKGLLKLGVAGGAVYYSVDQGVWGSHKESAKVYDKASKVVKENFPSVQTPSASGIKKQLTRSVSVSGSEQHRNDSQSSQSYSSWNNGVNTVFDYLETGPGWISSSVSSAVGYVSGQTKS